MEIGTKNIYNFSEKFSFNFYVIYFKTWTLRCSGHFPRFLVFSLDIKGFIFSSIQNR